MTTLKQDSSSYRASGVIVRDARHTHNGPSEPAHRSSKDKRRWCRGKVGVEHKLHVVLSRREWFPRLLHCCLSCGKEFGSYSGIQWGPWPSKPPEWASPEDLVALEAAKQEPRPEHRRR